MPFAARLPFLPSMNTRNPRSVPKRMARRVMSIVLPTPSRNSCQRFSRRKVLLKLETMPLMIVKKDNSREPYDRSKIEAGIIRSCHKRPVSSEQISSMADQIENALFNREEREISSSVIGELVMEKLKDLDAVAYVRFASVYREFKDVDTFMQELTKLLEHQERRQH